MNQIDIDAAFGNDYDLAGKLIALGNQEDSSGLRRHIVNLLENDKYDEVCKTLKISDEQLSDYL